MAGFRDKLYFAQNPTDMFCYKYRKKKCNVLRILLTEFVIKGRKTKDNNEYEQQDVASWAKLIAGVNLT